MADTVAMNPTLASGRDISKGHGEEWWRHPVWASSHPAFSTDLHKHHFTAHWETHLKPIKEEIRPKRKKSQFPSCHVSNIFMGQNKEDSHTHTLPIKELWLKIPVVFHLHGGALNSSQHVKNRVRSGAVLCSCERSSSTHCPGFAEGAAWMAGDQTLVWTTQAHLGKNSTH